MQGTSFISVIIPTYNRKNILKKTIDSLLTQSYPKDEYEIIVVDDGSTDGTQELAKIYQAAAPKFKYFFQKHKGPAAARNLGIKHAEGEIIAFIDSDCIASKIWLDEITKGYYNQRISGIGGMIKPVQTSSIINRYCSYIKMNERPKIDNTGIVYLITGNSSFRKDCLNAIEGFDERYTFPGGEDSDLCYRLKEKGYIFGFNRNAVVYSPHKQTLRELVKTYFNYGRGEVFLMLRKYSNWDLTVRCDIKHYFYLLRAIMKMIVMFFTNFKLILGFFKIPFNALSYYGDGFTMKNSMIYAFFQYATRVSFKQGIFLGYLSGKYKGFKKSRGHNFIFQ